MGEPPRALLSARTVRTWLFAILISIAFLAAAAVSSIFVERKWQALVDGITAGRIATLAQLPSANGRVGRAVIIMGTSLTRAALQTYGYAWKAAVNGARIEVVTGDAGEAGWVEALMPTIERLHPDMVVLETNLMRRPEGASEILRRIHHLEWAVFWRPTPSDGGKSNDACSEFGERASPKAGNAADRYQQTNDPTYLALDRTDLLKTLQSSGVHVAVLGMPRATELEAAAPNLIAKRAATSAALADVGIPFLAPPSGHWPTAYFCDMSHLDKDGAAVFDRWFSNALIMEMRALP